MISAMETPSTRADFEERMQIAREELRKGKVHFNKGLRGPESLLKVRYLPNRRIDLMSIDESARLHANMSYQMRSTQLGESPIDNKG
jgi:hypothetical protein